MAMLCCALRALGCACRGVARRLRRRRREVPEGTADVPELVLGDEIARGGYGVVYSGVLQGVSVAAKLIPSEVHDSLHTELFSYARLRAHPHANIAKLLSTSDHPSGTLLVMPRYGADLITHVRDLPEGRMDDAACATLVARMADAVAHLHGLFVAHCDIKLDNWLQDDAAGVVLVDFGLCFHGASADDVLQRRTGSVASCAPEVLRGEFYNPFRADVYSLGICAFGMLAGFYPFERASEDDAVYSALRAQGETSVVVASVFAAYDQKSHASAAACAWVQEALCFDSTRRPSAAALRRHPWVCRSVTQSAELRRAKATVASTPMSRWQIAAVV